MILRRSPPPLFPSTLQYVMSIEEHLYHSSESLQQYADLSTLNERMQVKKR